jgi:hypothetical protein
MLPPNSSDKNTTEKPPKLLDQVRGKLRVKHYSIRTEQTYVDWIKRFIFFHGKRRLPTAAAPNINPILHKTIC